jgi:hypothetical protein
VESKWEETCIIEGAHERPIYSISWAQVDIPGLTNRVAEDEDDRGLILSTGGDGRIKVWHITVCIAHPLQSSLLANALHRYPSPSLQQRLGIVVQMSSLHQIDLLRHNIVKLRVFQTRMA